MLKTNKKKKKKKNRNIKKFEFTEIPLEEIEDFKLELEGPREGGDIQVEVEKCDSNNQRNL